METDKNKTNKERRGTSALTRLLGAQNVGHVELNLPIKRCVEQIREAFDLPNDDVTNIELASIIHGWHQYEIEKLAKIVQGAANFNIIGIGIREEG